MRTYRYPNEKQLRALSDALTGSPTADDVVGILFPPPVDRKQHQWKHYVPCRNPGDILPRECQKCGLYVHSFKVPNRDKYDTRFEWPDGSSRSQPKPNPIPPCPGKKPK